MAIKIGGKIVMDSEFAKVLLEIALNSAITTMLVTSFVSIFVRKSEERTRIAGTVVEKRFEVEPEILYFVECALEEKVVDQYDVNFEKLLLEHGLTPPYNGKVQYAKIFSSPELFEKFLGEFRDKIARNKLWMDVEVVTQLIFMQDYFERIKIIPLIIKSIPFPKDKKLSKEEFDAIYQKLLWVLGYYCDIEVNAFKLELNEKVIDSVHRLKLSRLKKKIIKKSIVNSRKHVKEETAICLFQNEITNLIIDFVMQEKGN